MRISDWSSDVCSSDLGRIMNAYMLITGSGPIVVLTSHASAIDSSLIEKLAGKGIEKFIAYEIPIDLAKRRYGKHFSVVESDLRQTDDLRILDYNGGRAFNLRTEEHTYELQSLMRNSYADFFFNKKKKQN